MDKRYQVFISSTFADLEEERKGIMQAIIELDCFPAGMEMFPATDSEQFEYIKTVIDESDYYVLIVAGRYGSLAEDGISYTEKEFEYAKAKGIPILVFVKKDIKGIPVDKTDDDPKKRKKLEAFRAKVLEGRMASFWDTAAELKYSLHSSLSKEFKTHPRVGWIRSNSIPTNEVYAQLNVLQEENRLLKNENVNYANVSNEKQENLDILNKLTKEFEVDFTVENSPNEIFSCLITIKEIIIQAGLRLQDGISLDEFESIIQSRIIIYLVGNDASDCYITDYSSEDIQRKLLALKFIYRTPSYNDYELKFTDLGISYFLQSVDF